MTRKDALKIARWLISRVFVTAANSRRNRDFGYVVACGPRRKTKIDVGTYQDAIASRREWIEQMADQLQDGTAPEWASLEFVW